jgi:hypothetical protein
VLSELTEPEPPVLDDAPELPVLEDVAVLVRVVVLRLVVVGVVVEPEVVAVVFAAVAACLASAGSWPVTSISVISSHSATNSARAPATTRRRIMLTRWRRASRIAVASTCVMQAMIGARCSKRVSYP